MDGAEGTGFDMVCLSDTGCSRTVIAKNIVEKFNYPISPNVNNERLLTANKQPMNVNGVVHILGSYKGRSTYMDCLVSDQLEDEIIVSWYDAENVGAITIDRDFNFI